MKRLYFVFSFFMLATLVLGQEKTKPEKITGDNMDVQLFLKYLRYPRVAESWMKMKGTIIHKSADGKFKVPIEIRGRFQSTSWRMQIVVDGQERWFVRQNFEDGEFGTSKIKQKAAPEGKKSLADMQIRPEDITLSFLYWKLVKEEKREKVSRQPCRVLRLKHQNSGEEALIWASTKYVFPMKVQWFPKGATNHSRELLFRGVTTFIPKSRPKMKFSVVDEVKVSGKGWKTVIDFDKPTGDAVTDDMPPPADLFIRDEEPAAESETVK